MFERKESNGFESCKRNHSTLDVLNVIACNLIIVCILVQPLHAAIDSETKNGDTELAAGTQSAINKNDEIPVVKRAAAGQRAYSFGLGKRDSEATLDENESDADLDTLYDKRQSQRFSFGLGKRATDYRTNGDSRFSFGLGKRDLSDDEDTYSASKRAQMQRYQFGLGKKSAPSRYAFGIGKRQYVPRQFEDLFKRRYSFGLGK